MKKTALLLIVAITQGCALRDQLKNTGSLLKSVPRTPLQNCKIKVSQTLAKGLEEYDFITFAGMSFSSDDSGRFSLVFARDVKTKRLSHAYLDIRDWDSGYNYARKTDVVVKEKRLTFKTSSKTNTRYFPNTSTTHEVFIQPKYLLNASDLKFIVYGKKYRPQGQISKECYPEILKELKKTKLQLKTIRPYYFLRIAKR